MSYDFEYYSGSDLRYPTKPIKPSLGRNPSAIEARAFADALEEYEREFESYKEDLGYYNSMKSNRMLEFKNKIRDDYDITQAQFDILWRTAWENGHSSGLHDVLANFEHLYELATEFAALEKG